VIEPKLVSTIAPCGLVCGVCVHATPEREGCAGCREGGGDKRCYQRTCCQDRSLQGCWECDEFPCEHGYFVDPAWRGICIGSVHAIRDLGLVGFVERLVSRVGTCMEIADHRHRDPQDVRAWLGDEPGSTPIRDDVTGSS